MRVLVLFPLREVADTKEINLEFPDKVVTIDMVLRKLVEGCDKGSLKYAYDIKTGELKAWLHILVNGRSISMLNGLKTELADGDVLAIFPPMGGG
jgi:molybdopterin synthase sulfur carrier subunit